MLSRRNRTIYRIRTPQFGVVAALGIVRSVGFFATWTIAVTILIFVAGTINSLPSRYGPFILIGILGISFLAAYLWVRAFNWWHKQRVASRCAKRTSRLIQFLALEEARIRFPHRVLELAFRCPQEYGKDYRSILMSFPPGSVIINNETRTPVLPRLCGICVGFEPIPLEKDTTDAAELIRSGLEKAGCEVELDFDIEKKITWRTALQKAKASDLYLWAIGVGPILFFVLWALYRGHFFVAAFFCAILLLSVLSGVQAFGKQQWWIVPGGLAFNSHGAFGRKNSVQVFSRESSPLLLDMRDGLGIIREDGVLISFRFSPLASWVLASVWLGNTTCPSREAIESCLNTRKQETEQ